MNALLEKESTTPTLPFGLIELDCEGIVRYYKPDSAAADSAPQASELIGRNLYEGAPALAQCTDFRDRIRAFSNGKLPADSFPFTFSSDDVQVQAKVLLARIHEQASTGAADYILIHIRKVEQG